MKIIRIVNRKEEAGALNKELSDHKNNINNKNGCIILHFFMKGCIHCENLEPKMKRLEEYMTKKSDYNNVTLGKIDAELMDSVDTENAYQFPTLRIMTNGKTREYTGAPEESAILRWINSMIEKNNSNKNNNKNINENNKNKNNNNSNKTIVVHLSNHNSLGAKSLKNNSQNQNKNRNRNISSVKASGIKKTHKRRNKKRNIKKRRTGKRKTKKMKNS